MRTWENLSLSRRKLKSPLSTEVSVAKRSKPQTETVIKTKALFAYLGFFSFSFFSQSGNPKRQKLLIFSIIEIPTGAWRLRQAALPDSPASLPQGLCKTTRRQSGSQHRGAAPSAGTGSLACSTREKTSSGVFGLPSRQTGMLTAFVYFSDCWTKEEQHCS